VEEDIYIYIYNFFWGLFFGFLCGEFSISREFVFGESEYSVIKILPFFLKSHSPKKLISTIIMPIKFATICLQHKKRVQKKKIFKSPNLIFAT